MIKLYDYYRSTASYRVRIALNLKNVAYETIEINLVNNGGEQHSPQYQLINPQELVPTLHIKDEDLTQSIAILEYLDETIPQVSLLPPNPLDKAKVRALALMIACDIHPLNNLRVLKQLRKQFKSNESQITDWYHHWLMLGFDAIEKQLATIPRTKNLCFGSEITMADVCLIPQVYNAKRFHFPLDNYPLINAINNHCNGLNPFINAAP
jgi:maleylacetoacetate isomerase